MEVLETFHRDGVIDCFTFVTDERDPRTGYYTMLATSLKGRDFSQWTEGLYDPAGHNEHLGNLVCVIGKRLLEHVTRRLAE